MKIKTSELTGAALDWAVAQCEFDAPFIHGGVVHAAQDYLPWSPHVDWAQGGPIIDREKIATDFCLKDCIASVDFWSNRSEGPTTLIAAMRCYVVSKIGDEVDIPEELL